MTNSIRVLAVLMLLFAGGCAQFSSTPVATAQVYTPVDSYQQYVQRSDKLTLSSGNTQEVNTRIQEIDPWPRNVGNTRIAADGQRMADAVYRYRCNSAAPQPLPPGATSNTATTGAGSTAAGTAAVGRPGSGCPSGGGAAGGSGAAAQ
jgi:hypothetical protein